MPNHTQNLLKLAADFERLAKSGVKAKKPKIAKFPDGYVICGEFGSQEVDDILKEILGGKKLNLIISDPPYSDIVPNDWDKNINENNYIDWTNKMLEWLRPGGSAYVWGCRGKPGNRTFFKYLSRVEDDTGMTLQNLIIWSKRRAYGTKYNYLDTGAEYCAWLTNGERPNRFKVPLLDEKRGYAGFNKNYPALSEYKRRTNVWSINEIFSGKIHICEKPVELAQIMIEVHTKKGEYVLDPFAGSGSSACASINLGRKFIAIERDPTNFKIICNRLKNYTPPDKTQPHKKKASFDENTITYQIESIKTFTNNIDKI